MGKDLWFGVLLRFLSISATLRFGVYSFTQNQYQTPTPRPVRAQIPEP